MKCISSQWRRLAARQNRRILITTTVLIWGFIFWCFSAWDRSLDPDGPSWEVSDVMINNELDDEENRNLMGLLQNKLKDLKKLAMIKYLDVEKTCNSTGGSPMARVGKEKLRKAMDAFDVRSEGRKYIFLTAASSNHFHESRVVTETLRRNVLPYISNYSLIFYDLGLCEAERNIVRNTFGFELKRFPFDCLPNRARHLGCYTWKPFIIAAHIQHCEVLVWLDSSIRSLHSMVHAFFNVTKTGVLIGSSGHQFPQHVMLTMFSYFGDLPCHYSKYEEVEGGFLILHSEPFVRHLIIEPWTACALDPTCMCPDESRNMLKCPSFAKYGMCHRFDQATMGYILHKLFRETVASVILPPNEVNKVVRFNRVGYDLDILCRVLKGLGIRR